MSDKGNKPPQPGAKDSRVSETGVYEMQWDCEFCGTTKLLGVSHRFCPNCGAPQNPQRRYFPLDADKVALKDHVYSGPDRVCPACANPNGAKAEFCSQCGSPLSEAAAAKRQTDQVRGAGGDHFVDADATPAPKPPSKKRWIIAALVLLVVAGISALLWTKPVALSLQDHSWERQISIELFGPISGSDWCDSKPSDAYQVSSSREVRSYKQIPDGETCSTRRIDQGDGSYSEQEYCTPKYREEPVYDNYCRYTIDRWHNNRQVEASNHGKEAHWPAYQLSREGQCNGCERVGAKSEAYYLHLSAADGQEYRCDVAQELWRQSQAGSAWQVKVGVVDGAARCGSLVPAP